MHIRVLSVGLEMPPALQRHAEIRTWAALQRFAPRVPWATVRVEDCNGPRGGVDKRCLIEVGLDRVGSVVAEHTDPDVRAAVDGATVRLKQAVSRRAKRHWQHRRRDAVLGRQAASEQIDQAVYV